MKRQEKSKLLLGYILGFNCKPDKIDEALQSAYQYGLQQGKKEAVKDFDKKQKSHSNKPHSSHDWQSALSICWRCVEDRKEEMLEPLSTPTNDEQN